MLFGKYASRKSEARYPELWDGIRHVYCPAIQSPSSLDVYDFGGRNFHGLVTTRTADLAWTRGTLGNTLLFAGANTGEATSTQGRVVLTRDLAAVAMGVSCWLLPSSLAKRGICTSGPNQSAPSFAITLLTTGQLEVYRGGNTTSTATLSAGSLAHIFVWNDSVNTSYWVNGVFSNSAAQGATPALQSQFFFGSNYWGSLDGQIPEFAVYDRLPTSRAIKRMSTAPGMMFIPKRAVNYGSLVSVVSRRSLSSRIGSRSLN